MKKYTLYNIIRRTLLTLCLMVTVSDAWAAEVTNAAQLEEALAGMDGTITLTSNITLSKTLTINRAVTLNLNGHLISANGFRAFEITQGDVNIVSDTPATISVDGDIANNSSVIRVGDGKDASYTGTKTKVGLTLGENVTVSTAKCYGITVFGSHTLETVVINGKVTTTNVSAISGNGNAEYAGTDITIGETAVITTTNDVAVYHPQNGTLTVKSNASITGAGGIEMKAGQLVVEDGAKITATGSISHSVNNDGTSTRGYAIAIVENGQYAGVSAINVSKAANITGAIAMVMDSENTTTEGVEFDPSGMQMQVKVTDSADKLVGQYQSLELALSEAPAGATITLLDNVKIASTIETTKNYTLDLNGKTLTSDGQRALWIKSGEVTIKSSAASPAVGKITVPTITENDKSVIRVGSAESANVSLTVEQNVTISADECYGLVFEGQNANASLTVNGNVSTKNKPAIAGQGPTGSATTISIGATANINTSDDVAIYNSLAGTVNIDGTVTGAGGIEMKGGALGVTSTAHIKATGTPLHVTNNTGCSSVGYAVAVVQNGANGQIVTNVSIDNSAEVTGAVAQLYDSEIVDFNPSYTGKFTTKVAAIGDDEYFTLNDAIAIVPSEGTVKLINNLALTETFEMDAEKTYTFDLNNNTLTGNGCVAVQVSHGHVTITNGTITNMGTADAVVQLGDNDGSSRNVSLTLTNTATVTSGVSTGVLLSGTATRETLEVKGSITTTGYSAIVAADEIALIHVDEGATVSATGAVVIVQNNTGDLVVDGTVTGDDAIRMKGGDLTVSDKAHIIATGEYAVALVENAANVGVGKVNINKDADITGIIACLVESENNNVAEPLFTGDIYMIAETNNTAGLGEKYATLSDAIDEAIAGGEVRLLDDLTVTETFSISKAITLNMDDYSMIGKQTSEATLAISAGVTLQNGSISSENDGVKVTDGTVNLKQVTIKASGVSLEVTGGTVSADQASTLNSTGHNTVVLGGGSLTLAGKVLNSSTGSDNNAIDATEGNLTIAATVVISSAAGNGINWASTGDLTVNGGKIMGVEAVYANKGSLTIEGGTFTGTHHAVDIATGCTPTVSGGTFICGADVAYKPITAASASGFVSGEYFSKAIAQELCASGYMVSKNPKNNGMFYLIDEIVINDGTIWNNTESFTIAKAKYVRNSGMGANGTQYGTLCLPFSFSATQTGMTFYTVNRIEGNYLYLDAVTSADIAAGTPVVFKCDDAQTGFTIESTNAAISAAGAKTENHLVGTFTKIPLTTTTAPSVADVYYLNSDAFHQAKSSLNVPAFRAYISFPSTSPVREQVLQIRTNDDEADVVGRVLEDGEIEAVYDLQGRKQNDLQKGMNIIKMSNGKTLKVYVNK